MTNDVEVRVSYKARTIGSLATGAAIVLASLLSVLVQLVSRPTVIHDGGGASPAPIASPITPSISPASYAFGLLGLLFLGIPLMFVAEKARIPLRMGPSGVTMRNGRQFPWNEYRGLRSLTEPSRSRTRTVEVGVELLFVNGGALIKYRPITNLNEVLPIVEVLRSGDKPWT